MTITEIILHHSLTKDTGTVSWPVIRKYHKGLGWIDIGYHFGIEDINGSYEILMGRMLFQPGAHTKGHNKNSIGICFVGNFDDFKPPEAQWYKGIKLVRWLLFNFRLTPDHVHGHNEFADYKTCPGKMFDLDKFRDDLHLGG